MNYCPNCQIGIDYNQMKARKCNNCLHTWDNYHVMPLNDLHEHRDSYLCDCKPIIDIELSSKNLIIIHNSYDGREGVEWAKEIIG